MDDDEPEPDFIIDAEQDDDAFACPRCREKRHDRLVFQEHDFTVRCASCGHVFDA
jgi:ribosomal protein S27E